MAKTRIGQVGQTVVIEGDVNLLNRREVLLTEEEGYPIVRKRTEDGSIENFIVIPIDELDDMREELEELRKFKEEYSDGDN